MTVSGMIISMRTPLTTIIFSLQTQTNFRTTPPNTSRLITFPFPTRKKTRKPRFARSHNLTKRNFIAKRKHFTSPRRPTARLSNGKNENSVHQSGTPAPTQLRPSRSTVAHSVVVGLRAAVGRSSAASTETSPLHGKLGYLPADDFPPEKWNKFTKRHNHFTRTTRDAARTNAALGSRHDRPPRFRTKSKNRNHNRGKRVPDVLSTKTSEPASGCLFSSCFCSLRAPPPTQALR